MALDISRLIQQNWQYWTHPVYNNLGRHIGYFPTDDDLCRGAIQLFTDEKANAGSPETWRVKNALGVLTPINEYCVSKGLSPVWLSASEAATLQQQVKPLNVPSLPAIFNGSDFAKTAKWVAIGGVAVVALVLIMRSGQRVYR